MDLTLSQIVQAAATHLMTTYGRHNANHIWDAINTAVVTHDAQTAALAATFTQDQFDTHETTHLCHMGCPPGCDIGRIRTWTAQEVVSRRQPFTAAELDELTAHLVAARSHIGGQS